MTGRDRSARHARELGRALRAPAGALVLFVAPTAWAQSASQITPPSFAPDTHKVERPVVLEADRGTVAPEGAAQAQVTLADVRIEGADPDPATLADLRARLTGKTVTVADIFAAAHALETRYTRAGSILTRVVVPAQSLDPGATLRLVVVRGYIERVDTAGVSRRVRARVAMLLARLEGRRDLDRETLERQLMLASDTPGVSLRSTLAQGSVPGATILVVEARHQPVTASISVDNSLSDSLGRYGFGLGIDLQSPLGLGEDFYLRLSGLPKRGDTDWFDANPRNRQIAGGLLLPLGPDGLTVNLEATSARAAPRRLAGAPGFASQFTRVSWRLRYPLVRSRGVLLATELAFDAQSERLGLVYPIALPLSEDRLRVLRPAVQLSAWLAGGGSVSGSVRASFGVAGLGARRAADASPILPLSRAGADADFRKLEIDARLAVPVGPLELLAQGSAQTSFGDPLANSEQFGLANRDAVSPLPSGLLQGDAGFAVRDELRLPLRHQGVSIAPYGFLAAGAVRFEQPTLLERRSTSAVAWGGGLRLGSGGASGRPGTYATAEYGRAKVQGLRNADRFTFSIVVQF